MEQSPSWETKRSTACQKLPAFYKNSKVHPRLRQRLLTDHPILIHINPIHFSLSHFLMIRFNSFLSSTSRSSKCSLSSGVPTKTCMHLSCSKYLVGVMLLFPIHAFGELWRTALPVPNIYVYAEAQLVEALCYKPESRGFDSRWCHWNCSLT
jgi:hypothetical protein